MFHPNILNQHIFFFLYMMSLTNLFQWLVYDIEQFYESATMIEQ